MPDNPENINFDPNVLNQIVIINDVFRTLGVPGIFENPDVFFDEFLVLESYLKFNLYRPHNNSVELDFHLMSDGMRIDFEQFPEAFEFSSKDIASKSPNVSELLRSLLRNSILVEYKGNARYVNLFNDAGNNYLICSLGSFPTLLVGGYWKSQNIDQHLFDPIYPATDSGNNDVRNYRLGKPATI